MKSYSDKYKKVIVEVIDMLKINYFIGQKTSCCKINNSLLKYRFI